MDWDTPPIFVKQKSGPGFRTVIFDLTQPADNVHRYYTVTWQTDLFGESNVVRSTSPIRGVRDCDTWPTMLPLIGRYGRKGGWNRTLSQPFDSLEAAWPFIRRTIKTRLRHGYQLVEMEPAP